MEITNKIAIVTGGTGGIGLCITKELLGNGAKCVAIFELDNHNTQSVFNDLKKEYGDRVEFYSCDVSKSNQLYDCMDKVIETHKTIDILINNAGVSEPYAKPELLIDVNFKAVILGSLAMIKRVGKNNGGQGGLIVNIASVMGLINLTMAPTYCATKHGVVSFTKSIVGASEAAGVRVVAVCPAFTKTPMTVDIKPEGLKAAEAKYKMSFPMQTPENVGLAVISIIKNGKNGDIWVSENDEPPYPAKVVDSYTQ